MEVFSEYRITSPYGWRKDPFTGAQSWHSGIDLVLYHQAPIYAFVSGDVIHAKEGLVGTGFGNYGKVVAIQDINGYLQCYCHLDSIDVKVGQFLAQGQVVGRQGTTGRSTGSHLHFEIRSKISPSYGFQFDVDPTEYLINYYQTQKDHEVAEWAKEAHFFVVKNKLSDGERPNDTVTRQEMWTMLHRLNKLKG